MEDLQQINRINHLFENAKGPVLSIYFTAGYPKTHDTMPLIKYLTEAGADLIEIGMPYSDPVADGPTIQASNQKALENGMSINLLMDQIRALRDHTNIPVILMGYINPVLQYGIEAFCKDCSDRGIDGLIIPDLPMQEYLDNYQDVFNQYGLQNIFLITPQTTEDRIRWIDDHSEGFIYAVSDASITGAIKDISSRQQEYFERLNKLNLKHPFLIGFGIYNNETFRQACEFAPGAIIGSAFIKTLEGTSELQNAVNHFVQSIKSDD